MPYYRAITWPTMIAPRSLARAVRGRGMGQGPDLPAAPGLPTGYSVLTGEITGSPGSVAVYGPPLSGANPIDLVNANTALQQQVGDLTAGIQYRDSLLGAQASTFQDFLAQHQSALLIAAAAVFGLVLLRGKR